MRTETESFDGSSVDRVDTVYDDQGRVHRVTSPYETVGGGGRADTYETEYDYDIRGRVHKLNRPDGGKLNIDRRARGNETQETVKETVYDDAGTEIATRTRVSRYNLLGELVRVTEGGGTASDTCSLPTALTDIATTSYAYNASGQLRTVSVNVEDMGNQVTKTVASFAYDAVGNRSQSTHEDAGQLNLSYTALGELRTRTHAQKSDRNVTYTYDTLGRVTTATDSHGSSHWEYDGGMTGYGFVSRRCRMSDAMATGCGSSASFNETYTYNTDARLSSTITKVVSGSTTRTFTHSYGYDSNGRPSTTSYPSGLTTRREYNGRGYLSRVLDNGASKELLAYVDRDSWGNVTRERLGNGGFVTRTFDAASGRQLRQDVRLKGKLRHDALYEWRTDGLLKERSVRGVLDDGTTTGYREESFVHDFLGRLTQAAATSGTVTRTLTTSYDVLGNLLSKTSSVTADADVTGYNYTGTLNAVRYAKVGSARHQYSYDTSGRMTSDKQCLQLTGACTSSTETDELNDRYISWDGRGLATQVVVGSGLTDTTPTARETFRHGPDEAPFERFSEWKDGDTTQSTRTYYVGAYEKAFPESDADTASAERTRLPGGVVHVKTTPTTGNATEAFEYRHVDHLGSVVAVSDATATPLAVLGHDPFGDRRRADWKRELTDAESAALSGRRTARGFTGHEQLDRTGLVHMSGRLYDPQLGRFLSADRYVANAAMGQDWNRYSYVSNSPMSYVDPTGYVRAGPGCNVDGVFCAGPEQGGGFTRNSHGFEHRGQIPITIPVLTVSWGSVYGRGGYGFDHGLPSWSPRYTLSTVTVPVPFVFTGFLSVDGQSPADEPIPVVVVSPSTPGDYDALFDDLEQLWRHGGILVTQRNDSVRYQHRRATVLVKNNEPAKGIPRVHGRAVLDALELSRRERVPANVISGYRTDSENHSIHGAIDVYIDGYSTEETASALCSIGRFNRVSSYSGTRPSTDRRNTAHADYKPSGNQGLFDNWHYQGKRCR